jgi:hypothetical protein
MFNPVALVLVLAAFGLTLAGSSVRLPPRVESVAGRIVHGLLLLVVAGQTVALLILRPGIFLAPGTSLVGFRLGVLLLGLVILNYGDLRFLPKTWVFPLMLVVHFLLGAWLLQASPKPRIDVWYFQQLASERLLNGQNPYAEDYPNIYDQSETAAYYGGGVLQNDRIPSFPYPPLSLLLVLPGYLLGDVRWALLLAQSGTAAFLVARGRRLGLPPGHPGELVGVALLCHPRGLLVLENAWTEPLMALAVSACAWALAGRRKAGVGAALGGLFSVKQHGVFWLPCLWAGKCLRPRDLVVGVGGAALVVLPFLVWDFPALWRGVVAFHFLQPFRPDALSVPAAVYTLTGWQLAFWSGFLAAAGVGALVVWRAVPTLAHAALGGAALYLAFFLFNKQAFLNYYWFTQALLCTAVSASFIPGRRMVRGEPSAAGGRCSPEQAGEHSRAV